MFGSYLSKFRPDNRPICYKESMCFFAFPQMHHIFKLFLNTDLHHFWAPSDRREKRRPLALLCPSVRVAPT